MIRQCRIGRVERRIRRVIAFLRHRLATADIVGDDRDALAVVFGKVFLGRGAPDDGDDGGDGNRADQDRDDVEGSQGTSRSQPSRPSASIGLKRAL